MTQNLGEQFQFSASFIKKSQLNILLLMPSLKNEFFDDLVKEGLEKLSYL